MLTFLFQPMHIHWEKRSGGFEISSRWLHLGVVHTLVVLCKVVYMFTLFTYLGVVFVDVKNILAIGGTGHGLCVDDHALGNTAPFSSLPRLIMSLILHVKTFYFEMCAIQDCSFYVYLVAGTELVYSQACILLKCFISNSI